VLRVYGFVLGLGLWVRFESLEVRRGHSSFVQVGKGVPQTMFRGAGPSNWNKVMCMQILCNYLCMHLGLCT